MCNCESSYTKNNSCKIIASARDSQGNEIDIYNDKVIITYSFILVEGVPYGVLHDTNYYEPPYYDEKDVDVSDFEYKIDIGDFEECILDIIIFDNANPFSIDVYKLSDNDIIDYVKKNLEKVLTTYVDKIISSFEERASTEAFDKAVEIANDEYDYYEDSINDKYFI